MVPADHPTTFYVRVRTTNGYSPWLPVTTAQRATSTSNTRTDLAGALNDPVRAPAPTSPPSPFIIPGGGSQPVATTAGVTNEKNIPLWVKLTKIVCERETDDGYLNYADEVYAVIATVAVNRNNMAESIVNTIYTNIYEDFDKDEVRSMNLNVWGPTGEARAIFDANDVIIFVAAIENDGDYNRSMAALTITSILKAKLSKMSSTTSRADLINTLKPMMLDVLDKWFSMDLGAPLPGLETGEDLIGHDIKVLGLTATDVDAARSGNVVKKPLDFESSGYYELRFQLGKEGVSYVAW
jgi:hypothetical protein